MANFARDQIFDAIIANSIKVAMVAVFVSGSLSGTLGEEIDVIRKGSMQLLHLFLPEIISYVEDIADAGGLLVHAAVAACK